MSDLITIRQAVHARGEDMIRVRGDWPCRKGCDDCCRRLASIPLVSGVEWELIRAALDDLPAEAANMARLRIREASTQSRPFTCPLLDRNSGTCTVYAVRPVECRTYGFYVERDRVLGCERIEALADETPDVVWGNHENVVWGNHETVVWGNHETVKAELDRLGPAASFCQWLNADAILNAPR